MAHSKVSTASSISNILASTLQLNSRQAEVVDQLEYEFYRSYQFDVPKFHSERVASFRIFRKLLPILERPQILRLKEMIKERKQSSDQLGEENGLETLLNYFHFLGLSSSQEKLIHKFLQENPYGTTEECLEILIPSLTVEQYEIIDKAKQADLIELRRSEETWVRRAYKYLVLNEKQIEKVVDFKVENNNRAWGFGEELKEEAQLMKEVLNLPQLGKYQAEWEKLTAKEEQQLQEQENHNVFSIQWEEGIQTYIRNVLRPRYQIYRKRFEGILHIEERKLIQSARRKVLQSIENRLQKAIKEHRRIYGNRMSSALEMSRKRAVQSKLMPAVGSKEAKAVEKDLIKIIVRHEELLQDYFLQLRPADEAFKNFMPELYERLGGTYGSGVMVLREKEDGKARNKWHMNFLLLDPNVER